MVEVDGIIKEVTTDKISNLKQIKKIFGNLQYTDITKQSILHILVSELHDEEKCFWMIKTLLDLGFNPNLEDEYKFNFVQTAIQTGYSEEFILKIIKEGLKHNLDVNHTECDNDTIIHTALYSDSYNGNVDKIYELLCMNGFDSTIRDYDNRDVMEAMFHVNKYNEDQYLKFEKIFKEQKKNNNYVHSMLDKVSIDDIGYLEKFGKILNKKQYLYAPTIGREKEMKNIIVSLAQDKKSPLLVGESGVGKTVLADELAYRIKNNQVPKFLQGKIVLEVSPSEVVAGCRNVGDFEENMTKLMDLCEKYEIILFIDEIHTIYGVGSSSKKDNDMASMLKYYIDRSNIKVIGTTTSSEYEEYFSNNALKRRFEKIIVLEPADNILYKIVNKVIEDYYIKTSILFEDDNMKDKIIEILLEYTKKNNRVYNDILNNPDLIISIIDKAFAFAKVYDSEFITIDHFIDSIKYCDRIYDFSKERAISKLRGINPLKEQTKGKILKVDFNNYKR